MAEYIFDSRNGATIDVEFQLNGEKVLAAVSPIQRLSTTLRDQFGLKSVKSGCDAGDCGACTVMMGGQQVCSCMVPTARIHEKGVTTLEGMQSHGTWSRIQQALYRHGAAQCGVCMPGMIMAATHILGHRENPSAEDVRDAMAGVLCRCTGYQKIMDALLDCATMEMPTPATVGHAVGASVTHSDGRQKLSGQTRYGADEIPTDALWLKVVRSPHPAATFELGDIKDFVARHIGIHTVLTAADISGFNGFGVYPDNKDQPVLAEGIVRYRGEAVVAVVGEKTVIENFCTDEFPITYLETPALIGTNTALTAPAIHDHAEDNILTQGLVISGDVDTAFAQSDLIQVEGSFETGFVEHAYIEPEAGYAIPTDDGVVVHASTQAPYMDRAEVANVLGLAEDCVRIIPTACGGGFGGKLDISVEILTALAAKVSGRTVACVYSRPESMTASTKRHPANITARIACDDNGRLQAMNFAADFDTGAYASWGPTVASRVPVHASGPYKIPNIEAKSRAIYTNGPPAGAFRGFGVPQVAIAQEALFDELAARLNTDRLDFRLRNAFMPGDTTATGQTLEHSVGIAACLEALQPSWQNMLTDVETFNSDRKDCLRRGAGIAGMWYGIGNTSLSNPSSMRIALRRNGRVMLYNGAVDIGQGSTTILAQIAADALGIEMVGIDQVIGDTGQTADAGKTSASRQTYVSGKAVELAALDLRAQILRLANAGDEAVITLSDRNIEFFDGGERHEIALASLPTQSGDELLVGQGSFDPETTTLDENGQGNPYATYAFGAQAALVEVDIELGTTKVIRMTAAHDVGKAINPSLVEGQIHGAIAQGLGLALMEEYVPGQSEDLHNYLIPTFGDMPKIEVILIEDAEPTGPSGAKGIGEPALIATAPAIFSAIRQATGVQVRKAPAAPARLRDAIRALAGDFVS